jgi:hypothetical protein
MAQSRPLKSLAPPAMWHHALWSAEAGVHPDPQAPSPRCRCPNRPWPMAPISLGGGRRRDHPLLSHSGGSRQGRCGRLHHDATTSPSSTCTASAARHGEAESVARKARRAFNATRFKGARLRTPVSACLQEHRTRLVSKQVKGFTVMVPRTRTYILERTWDLFTGRPNEPSSGAARLVPTDSGATPLRPAAQVAVLRSPSCSGAVLPTSAMVGVYPWPPPAGGKLVRPGPRRPG